MLAAPAIGDLGFVVAMQGALALRDGVVIDDIVVLPPSLPAGTGAGPIGAIIDRDQEIRLLELEIAELHRAAGSARRSANESKTETNRRTFRRDADQAVRNADRLRQKIDDLRSRPRAEVPLPADAFSDPVVNVLTRIANPQPATDAAEAFAVHQVIRDTWMTVDGLLLRGAFRLAVPITRNRQLLLGPIPFAMPNTCRNGAAIWLQQADFTRGNMAPAFRSPAERQLLVTRLKDRPGIRPQAAEVAATAFFAAVTALLLGMPSGERASRWNDPRWADHLRCAYAGPRARALRAWLQVDAARQSLAYAVADADTPLGREEAVAVLARVGMTNAAGRLHQLTADPRQASAQSSTSWKNWPPAVFRTRSGPGRSWRLDPRRCPRCGGPASLVVNVPELPFGCMCPCGGVPGLPADLLAPANYAKLAPTREMLDDYVAVLAELETLRSPLSP